MKSFNRHKQALQTIKALVKSRPQSWAQAIIKQARLAALQDRAERLLKQEKLREWSDDDYYPHEH